MVVAVAIWSLVLQPGKAESVIPPGDLKITNIALGEELADEKSRTSVRLVYSAPRAPEDSEDEEEDEDDVAEEPTPTILCSLTPGKIEHAQIELILEAEQEVVFETIGKNVVYLTGNYIDQQPESDQPPYDDEIDSDDEGLPLEDYPSDLEVDTDELEELSDDADRFEEVVDEEEQPEPVLAKSSKKRSRESENMDIDEQPKISKAEKKKLKKQKTEDGKAVTTAEEKPEPEVKKDAKGKAKEVKNDTKEKTKKEENTQERQKREEKELSGGIKSWDHKTGSGPQAKSGDKVSVRYLGKLTNGKVFDSNTKGKPFVFRLGAGEVIKGWDIGIVGMQAGGERLLTIPAPMAYGKRAQSGIPANSTLIFEVKLVKIN